MKFKGNKLLTALIVLLMAAALLSSVALAESEAAPAADVEGSKVATELDKNNRETTVTLKLPSGEYQNKVDVVFVMDTSKSIQNINYLTAFANNAAAIFDALIAENDNIELKVGVVKYKGFAEDMLNGLLPYSSDEKENIKAAITGGMTKTSSGSNLHSGLVMGKALLDEDDDVPAANKYLILLTDCKTYSWVDADGKPLSFYAQYYKGNAGADGVPQIGQLVGASRRESGNANSAQFYWKAPYDAPISFSYPDFDKNGQYTSRETSDYYQWIYDFEKYNNTTELSSVTTPYDYPFYYSGYYDGYAAGKPNDKADGTSQTITPGNGTSIFTGNYTFYRNYYKFTPEENSEWADEGFRYLTVNPYLLDDDGNFDTTQPDPDFFLLHPDSLQKGTYQAGHTWTEINDQYITAVLTPPASTIANGTGLHLAGSFSVWMRENSDFSLLINTADPSSSTEFFDDIDNSIRYMVASGVVKDVIADDFTLKNANNENGFRMTLDGEELARTYVDGKWNFGNPDATSQKYPYVVEYNENTKTIIWTINVPVENAKPVTLSYTLILYEDAESGTYDTNESAVLDYVTTDGKGGEYTFDKPKVTYNTSQLVIIKKVRGIDQSRLPEDELFFTITGPSVFGRDGKMTVYYKEFVNGVYTIDAPPGIYTVTEDRNSGRVPGYILRITGNGETQEITDGATVFNIINTYEKRSNSEVPEELNGEDHYAYIVGYPDGMVHPNANITRAEVAAIFFRLLTEETREANLTHTNTFGDVDSTMWFNTSVSTMAHMGIVVGYPDGDFHPNANITRAEFATIAARFDKLASGSGTHFSDIDGHWAKKHIERAAERGWVSGYPDGTFKPERMITRAEAASLINRVLIRDPETVDDLLEGMIEWPDNADLKAWYYIDIQEATNSHEYERQTKPTETWIALEENPDWSRYSY